MRLAIMQPYFFPYLGHFSLIDAADEWIIFDTSQYTPKTWMNRNRVTHPAAGTAWLTVPLSNGSIHIRSHQALIHHPERVAPSLLGQLSHYRRAPFYRPVTELVSTVLSGDGDPSLVSLNQRALQAVCAYVGLPFRFRRCSELGLDLPNTLPPGEWAPFLCAKLGASAYVNPAGGRSLFTSSSFESRGLSFSLLHGQPFTDQPRPGPFNPNLSILDVLMWNSPVRVLAAIKSYSLEAVC